MQNLVPQTMVPQKTQSSRLGKLNYAKALQKSYVFDEVQCSGDWLNGYPISWRGDSVLTNGSDVGCDLLGSYGSAATTLPLSCWRRRNACMFLQTSVFVESCHGKYVDSIPHSRTFGKSWTDCMDGAGSGLLLSCIGR